MPKPPVPRHKGTGMIPVVHGLKMLPGGREVVPEPLRHYLEERLLPSAWYPEADYEVLIQLLATIIPAEAVGGDIWAYFGRTGAQRDLAGQQELIARSVRLPNVGAYRNLAGGAAAGVAGLALRAVKLWRLYHDTGVITFERSPTDPEIMVTRITDFSFAAPGLVDMQMHYLVEFGRLARVPLDGTLTRSVFSGHGYCEWHYRIEPTPEARASLAQLPVAAPR